MGWDEPTLEVNALIPSQLAARLGTTKAEKVKESAAVDFEIRGNNLVSGEDPLQLVLVRRDPRFMYLANQGEVMLGGLRPTDIIPLQEVKPDEETGRTATARGMIRERAPGAYDLIAYRSPRIDGKVATNEAAVLRSALVILEPPPEA